MSTKSTGGTPSIEFSKKFSTADLYKQYQDKRMSNVEAIKEVSKAFDVFCKETKNVDYLINRYAELYNHKKVITPLAFGFITIVTSTAINIGYDAIRDMFNAPSIIFVIIGLMIIGTLAWIFKTMKNTYTPYDIFVLSYERKRLYEELTSRGYIVEPIGE